MVHGLAHAAASRHEASRYDGSLGHRVDLTVGAAQRCHQQQTALQITGIADGRGGNVDPCSRLREGRERRGHHHGSRVGDANGGSRYRHAHSLQHIGETLGAEDGSLLVAGFVEPHHHAITDQLVLAHAFHRDDVLQPRGGLKPPGRDETQRGEEENLEKRRHRLKGKQS
jgi:hypothetical protein